MFKKNNFRLLMPLTLDIQNKIGRKSFCNQRVDKKQQKFVSSIPYVKAIIIKSNEIF